MRKKGDTKMNILEDLSKIILCLVFYKGVDEVMEKQINKDLKIENVEMPAYEEALLSLNPNYAFLKCLSIEDKEHDIELGMTKLMYEVTQLDLEQRKEEIQFENAEGELTDVDFTKKENDGEIKDMPRQVYNPFEKISYYGNKRVTDLP